MNEADKQCLPLILTFGRDKYKRTCSMSKSTKIEELTSHEVSQLLTNKKFSKLKPSSCNLCGEKKGFLRRIFEVYGVAWFSGNC